ncbi:MAG TPA: ABC transporter permease [Opitutaceae bacterium]|nr:ABC transporter permease [Opitutaceae bacterium]
MLADLRYALRQVLKSPGFTAVVALSLAFGIGANAVVLCWLRSLVLRPMSGVTDQARLVALVSNQGGGCASLPDLRDFAAVREVFVGTEASMSTTASLVVDRQPEWVRAEVVTANYFELLGVAPLLGRTFLPDEDRKPGGDFVVVIGEQLWRRRFSSDPDIVGREIELNRRQFTVVGVVPQAFLGSSPPAASEIWAPASMIWEVRNQSTGFLDRRTARGWHNLARLRPGVTLEQAQAAVTLTDARLAAAYPKESTDIHHRVAPLSKVPWGGQSVFGPVLWLLLAVSLGVQLIVAANVANLLLARAVNRTKEIAVRLAAGADRARLLRLFLVESALLTLVGTALGVLLASWLVNALPLLVPAALRQGPAITFGLDGVTLGLTVLVALATGLGFGLVPAWRATSLDLASTLKDGGRAATGGVGHHRLRNSLVVVEVALAVLLVVGAGLCVRGLRQARRVDVGFTPDRVLIAGMQIGMNGYDRDTGLVFYRRLRERLASSAEVEEAALASWFPLGLAGCKGWDVNPEGYQRSPGDEQTFEYAIVSPRYFATMRIPLLAGRDFTDADDANAPGAAIVNEELARRFWPGQDPLGRRFRTGGVWRTIVGVAQTGKYNRVDERPRPFFYLPYQQGVPDLDLGICVRTKGDPAAYAPALRRVLRELDPAVEVQQAVPLALHSGLALLPQRLAVILLVLLGAVALGLAAMGVYAVMAYTVSQRTREFGVRMALGAQAVNVVRQVLRQGLGLTAAGVAIGLCLAAGITRLLAAFLFGVSPFDPFVFLGVPLVLAAVAGLACWLPARRATQVDPMIALRAD